MDSTHLNLGDRASAELDPLLAPLGFVSSWGIHRNDGESVTFCVEGDAFADRFPHLDAITAQLPDEGGGCVDLVIEATPGVGIHHVALEGLSLSDLLSGVGLVEDAELVTQWPGGKIDTDLKRVGHAMTLLLGSTA